MGFMILFIFLVQETSLSLGTQDHLNEMSFILDTLLSQKAHDPQE